MAGRISTSRSKASGGGKSRRGSRARTASKTSTKSRDTFDGTRGRAGGVARRAQKSTSRASVAATVVRAKKTRQKQAQRRHLGKPLWKTPPAGVVVIPNDTGRGHYVEKWASKEGTWVYNYTVEFVRARAEAKFADNLIFGQRLSAIRKRYRSDLKKPGPRRSLALIVALIDQACFRVGNEKSEGNGVYGVTTLRPEHLTIEGKTARFDYVGKKRVEQHRVVVDAHIAKLLKALKKKAKGDPDARLFREGSRNITGKDVNAYLAEFGVSAKQFRTYHATRMARQLLLKSSARTAKDRSKAVKAAIGEVSRHLGNTATVCESSYVDPQVVHRFMEGTLK